MARNNQPENYLESENPKARNFDQEDESGLSRNTRGEQQQEDEQLIHYNPQARGFDQENLTEERQPMPGEHKTGKDRSNRAKPQDGSLK